MKVAENHVAMLRKAIVPLDTDERRELYRQRNIPRAETVKDIDKRYRWDLFWAAFNAPNMDVRAILATGDYNDAHIDTALRTIVKPINPLPNRQVMTHQEALDMTIPPSRYW